MAASKLHVYINYFVYPNKLLHIFLSANLFLSATPTLFSSSLRRLQGVFDYFLVSNQNDTSTYWFYDHNLYTKSSISTTGEISTLVCIGILKVWILCKNCDLRISKCLYHFDVFKKRARTPWRCLRGTSKPLGVVVKKWFAYKKVCIN